MKRNGDRYMHLPKLNFYAVYFNITIFKYLFVCIFILVKICDSSRLIGIVNRMECIRLFVPIYLDKKFIEERGYLKFFFA